MPRPIALLGLALLASCAVGASDATPVAPAAPVAPVGSAPSAMSGAETLAPGESVPPTTVPAVLPDGFGSTLAVVTKPDGSTCELCLWLAEESADRARGLMFVTDLGAGDGMAFRYGSPHTGTFWMKNTVLPLSIAFFDPEGSFVDSFDMEPCPPDEACPKYSTPRGYLVAVEVEQGRLAELGLVAGSTLELVGTACVGP